MPGPPAALPLLPRAGGVAAAEPPAVQHHLLLAEHDVVVHVEQHAAVNGLAVQDASLAALHLRGGRVGWGGVGRDAAVKMALVLMLEVARHWL